MAKRSGSSGDGGRGGQGELGPGKPTWQNFVHVYLTEHLRMRHRKDVPAFTAEAYEVAAPLPGAVSRRKGTAMAVRSILCDLARGLPAHPTPGEGQRYIQGQIDSGRLAGSTANAWLKYAGRVCRYARGWWPTVAVRDWPMDVPAFPEKRREVRAIANPAESIPRILASVPGLEERALLLVMLELGLRIGEARGLWWGDFDWRRATVTLHRQLARGEWAPLKSQRAYATMPIPPRAGELLVELYRSHPTPPPADVRVFTMGSKRLDRLAALLHRLDPVSFPPGLAFHAFRDTLGAAAVDSGQGIKDTQAVLRHQSELSTEVYRRSRRGDEVDLEKLRALWAQMGEGLNPTPGLRVIQGGKGFDR